MFLGSCKGWLLFNCAFWWPCFILGLLGFLDELFWEKRSNQGEYSL
jgi:hypothetical protein